MANGNAELARSAYEAFDRGDMPAVIGALADDIEWSVPQVIPHGGDARGREEVGEFFQRLASMWEDFGIEMEALVADGDRVVGIGRAHGKLDGTETGYGFVHSWVVRDGALARFDEYVDPPPALVAR